MLVQSPGECDTWVAKACGQVVISDSINFILLNNRFSFFSKQVEHFVFVSGAVNWNPFGSRGHQLTDQSPDPYLGLFSAECKQVIMNKCNKKCAL